MMLLQFDFDLVIGTLLCDLTIFENHLHLLVMFVHLHVCYVHLMETYDSVFDLDLINLI